MFYRVEYLTETTDEASVCQAFVAHSKDLMDVEEEAFAGAQEAREHGATGFQIRHLNAVDKVVAIAGFDDRTPTIVDDEAAT